MNNYILPFEITNNMLERFSSIMKSIGKLDNYKDLNKMPIELNLFILHLLLRLILYH